MLSSQMPSTHAGHSASPYCNEAVELARNAKLAPLLVVPWSIVCVLTFLKLLDVFGYAAGTPADEYSAGQWVLNLVILGLLLPIQMFVGFAMGGVASRDGAHHEGRSAMRLNAVLALGWWVLLAGDLFAHYL